MAREHGVLRKTRNSQATPTVAVLTDFLQGESMTTTTTGTIPLRFEDEYPEEANALMKLCSNKKLRDAVQTMEYRYPKKDRIYNNMNPFRAAINASLTSFIHGSSKTPYKRTQPKINRNAPWPCGSGKKYKKCCIIDE